MKKVINLKSPLKNITLLATLLTATSTLQAQSCAELNTDMAAAQLVSYEFNETELSSVLQLAAMAANKELVGLELVAGQVISASAKKVDVTAFVDALLLVNGFGFEETADSWVISRM